MFLSEDTSFSEIVLWVIPNRIVNILISPGGRGKLARPPGADDEIELDGDIPTFYIIVGVFYFIIPTLVSST